MLRRLARPLVLVGVRGRRYASNVFGHRTVKAFEVIDFSSNELANRNRNSSLLRLIEAYRMHGHRAAGIDPLNLMERSSDSVAALDPRRYGLPLGDFELRKDFISPTLPSLPEGENIDGEALYDVRGLLDYPEEGSYPEHQTISQIASRLAEVYCGDIGYEFTHVPVKAERRFLTQALERSHGDAISDQRKVEYWRLLANSEQFDRTLAKRFPTVKRYGLEGGEAMIVLLDEIFQIARRNRVEDVVLAMPHRGRLNVLTQLLNFDLRLLIRKLRGQPTLPPSLQSADFSDDVLSHLFTETRIDGLNLHLLPNPSHLETVTGVALGYTRGLMKDDADGENKRLSVQIHGDAAFGGQGVVAEVLNLASLPHFHVGGSIRIVLNNQLGYTTSKVHGRTSHYATDLAKSIGSPILHVNGDKVESVARAARLALQYQQKFAKDIVIDLVVYRRKGHNELDAPDYTSPVLYRKIATQPSVLATYQTELLSSNLITRDNLDSNRAEFTSKFDDAMAASESFIVPEVKRARGWDRISWPTAGEWEKEIATGVEGSTLKEVGRRSVTVPDHITVHPRLSKMHIAKRITSVEGGVGLDFSTCEALAIGSLMNEGFNVRLCGQDSGRGTFSQRHAILSDQLSAQITVPLQSITASPIGSSSSAGTFEIVNSPLSEYSVLGFEHGYSWTSPLTLPIWEAQFGDFLNTGQVVVDTHFTCGESKWGLPSASTYFLPHGFDSAGPEHSSARVERFLQSSNEPISRSTPFVPNFHVVNVTTAASLFHVMRRQMIRPYRKPLVVLTPKGILRSVAASSTLEEMAPGTCFKSVIDDSAMFDPTGVERVVFLSGKMYYDLIKERSDRNLDGKIAFVRLEEISPFPYSALESALSRYTNLRSITWAQEAPRNGEAYDFIQPRLSQLLPAGVKLDYCGRDASASVAPGVSQYFDESKKKIMEDVFRF